MVTHPKYQEVINLRKRGKSYREIAIKLEVSKNSVSRWCKDLQLPVKIKEIIKDKIKENKYFFETYNKQRHELVVAENKAILRKSEKEINSLSDRELMLIGVALYWGEGQKKQNNITTPRVKFVNSDPFMVKVFLKFLGRILHIEKERIRADVRIYPDSNEKIIIDFWSKVTGIAKDKIKISRQISNASQQKLSRNTLPYGTISLTVSSRIDFYKIKGWVNGIARNV